MVTLNVLVDEEDGDAVLDHLAKETTNPDYCGLADFCRRMGIVIQGHSMLGHSSRGVIITTAVGVEEASSEWVERGALSEIARHSGK